MLIQTYSKKYNDSMYTQIHNNNFFFVPIYKNEKSRAKKYCIKAKYENIDDQFIIHGKKK